MAGLRIVTDERVARFVSASVNTAFCPPYTVIGTECDDEIINGALFNVFEGASINVTVAGTRWTKGFLQAVGTYVFDQLGCERMTAITRCEEVVSYARRLGGEVEGTLRNHFGYGHDGIVLGVLRAEYRY